MQSEDSEFGHCREGALHVMLMTAIVERSCRRDEVDHKQLIEDSTRARCIVSVVLGGGSVHERRDDFYRAWTKLRFD